MHFDWTGKTPGFGTKELAEWLKPKVVIPPQQLSPDSLAGSVPALRAPSPTIYARAPGASCPCKLRG